MSVTTRSKILTLSGSQCFALLRAMASRETFLQAQIEVGNRCCEDLQLITYLEAQLDDIRNVRAKFSATPFTDGAL
jgi:hypothetical protein